MQIGPQPVPPPVQVIENRITLEAPPPDPHAIAEASVQSSQAVLVNIILPPPVEWANELLNLPDFLRTTPPGLTYEHQDLIRSVEQMKEHAWWLLPLLVLALGIGLALSRGGYGGRIMFALVASAGSYIWCRMSIEANNILCSAIGAPDLTGMLRSRLNTGGAIEPEDVGLVLLTIVWAIVVIVLYGSMFVRIFLLDVLMVIAPVALICYGSEHTEPWAQRWKQLWFGLCFSQVLVVVGLKVIGIFGVQSGIGWTLLTIFCLFQLRRLPGLLANSSMSVDGPPRAVRRFAQRQVVRRVTR